MFTEHGQDQDWISWRIRAIFSEQDWIWIFIFEKNDQDRTGYLFDFYKEISLRVIQDVKNDSGCVFFATVSDVVETATSETETWLKFRDETETLS